MSTHLSFIGFRTAAALSFAIGGALATVGCTADSTEPVSAPALEAESPIRPAVAASVCDYAGGQSLVVGPTTVPEHISGCCTHTGGAQSGYWTCPTKKTQYLGCANANGQLTSWGPYDISSYEQGPILPSGGQPCSAS